MKLPIIIGHRGARFTAPENSIPSFLNAVSFGSDGVELDVHLTKDKKLIVLHDSTLQRIDGSNVLTGSLTLKEIKNLDISHLIKKGTEKVHIFMRLFKMFKEGQFFVELEEVENKKLYKYVIEVSNDSVQRLKKVIFPRNGVLIEEKEILFECAKQEREFKNIRIPELSEVLNVLKGSKINIEIKRGENFYPGIIDALIKETKGFGYDNIQFSSFNYFTVKEIKRRYPFVKANRLYAIPLNPVKASSGVDGVNPFSLLVSKKGITKLHKNGKTVYPWVVNKTRNIVRFMLQGVDGIITDRPYCAVRIGKELLEILDEAL